MRGEAESAPVPFGRFRLLSRLGSGGTAEVHRAELVTEAGITRPVVIKRIRGELASDPAYAHVKEQFLEEARIAALLAHGNIAQVVDVGEHQGEPYLALELVHGKSLADLVDAALAMGKRLPPEIACYIAIEMCKGLHHAHTRTDAQRRPLHLVHRDISPQNVMISFEGEVKLIDFGIAKAYGEDRPGRSRTATGIVKGKYMYFSPEQARCEPLDARTDVFAAGAVLYEMLCGRLAFEGDMVEAVGRLMRGEFPRPSQVNRLVPPELEAMVLAAMATDKNARCPTALALQEGLASWLSPNAPRLNQATLANVMRYVFRKELEDQGLDAKVPLEFAMQVDSWPDAAPTQAHALPTEAAPANPRALRRRLWPWVLGGGAVAALAAALCALGR